MSLPRPRHTAPVPCTRCLCRVHGTRPPFRAPVVSAPSVSEVRGRDGRRSRTRNRFCRRGGIGPSVFVSYTASACVSSGSSVVLSTVPSSYSLIVLFFFPRASRHSITLPQVVPCPFGTLIPLLCRNYTCETFDRPSSAPPSLNVFSSAPLPSTPARCRSVPTLTQASNSTETRLPDALTAEDSDVYPAPFLSLRKIKRPVPLSPSSSSLGPRGRDPPTVEGTL